MGDGLICKASYSKGERKIGGTYHSLEVSEVVRGLNTNVERGLADEEATKRLREFGMNVIEVRRVSPLRMFLRQFANFLVGILLVATAISAVLGELVDAAAIAVIVVVMGVMGFAQEYKAERIMETLRKFAIPKCRVLRSGRVVEVDPAELVPGDVIILREGDLVPADGRLVEVEDLEVDESPLTGESTPVEKSSDTVLPHETPVSDRVNMVFRGTMVVRGRGKAVVVATGMDTELGRIAKAVSEVKEERTPLERELDKFGRRIGVVILIIAGVVFATSIVEGYLDVLESFMTAVALAVAAIPEGLPAIATAVLAIGAHRMAEKNALVRRLAAVEALGSVDVICSDKTGTITKGEMAVKVVKILDSTYEVRGNRKEGRADFVLVSGERADTVLKKLLEFLVVHTAPDVELSYRSEKITAKGPPTEVAAAVLAHSGLGREELDKAFKELQTVDVNPFDRFRKRKSTVHKYQNGYVVIVSGAPEVLLKNSTKIALRNGEAPLAERFYAIALKGIDELASAGYRTLGVAYKVLEEYTEDLDPEDIEKDLTFLGVLGIIDPPREGVREAVEAARRAGIKVVMVTGDHKLTATAVARMVGIDVDEGLVVEGRELDAMSDEELVKIVDKVSVFSRVTPEHKARIVRALKRRGYRVAMTGDGVNDAPALKMADVGVAMGIKGTDVAKEVSQLVLLDDNFVTIVEAIKEGRIIFENLKKPINYLLTCNFGEVASLFGSQLLFLPPPLKPIHLLWVNVTTDALPAIALGLEPAEPGIMSRPPRSSSEGFITKRKSAYYLAMGSIVGGLTLAVYWRFLGVSYELAQTLAFTALVISEFGRVLVSRSENTPIWRIPWNKWIVPALIGSLVLQLIVLYSPLSSIFKVVPIPAHLWLYLAVIPPVIVAVDETRKLLKLKI
ncbi:MAG: cation-translocating P-type ATPase [Sulfolobales archaeon]